MDPVTLPRSERRRPLHAPFAFIHAVLERGSRTASRRSILALPRIRGRTEKVVIVVADDLFGQDRYSLQILLGPYLFGYNTTFIEQPVIIRNCLVAVPDQTTEFLILDFLDLFPRDKFIGLQPPQLGGKRASKKQICGRNKQIFVYQIVYAHIMLGIG